MNKVKKLFSVQGTQDEDGNMVYAHGAGPTDNVYTRKEEAEEAGPPGGQTTDQSQSGFASQGQGSSSYTPDNSQSGFAGQGQGSSSYTDESARDAAGRSSYGSASNAPQIGRQDLGESLGGGYGGTSGTDRRTSGPTSPTGGSARSRFSGSGSNFVRGGSRGYGLDKPASGERYDNTSTNNPVISNTGATGATGTTGTTGPASGSALTSSTSGNDYNLDKTLSGEKYGTTSTDDPAFVGSTSGATATSGIGQGSGLTSGTNASDYGSGLTGASLTDRSVGDTTQRSTRPTVAGQASYAENPVDMYKDAHPTFTGNRLDPTFHESTQSYHEEVLNDETHHGGGWVGDRSDDAYAAPGTATTTSGSTAAPSYTSGAQSSRDAYSSVPSTSRSVDPTTTSSTTQPTSSSHNYGRDAALGAGGVGAGAAGYGLLEKGQGQPIDTSNTGPASKTTGPHSSNIANIVDPRVQPEPQKMKESSTVGPHQSDTFNTLDPRVQSNPKQAYAQQTQSHPGDYAQDAVQAGGTRADKAGGYDTYDHREPEVGQAYGEHPTTTTTGPGSAGAGAYSAYDGGRAPPTSTTTGQTAAEPHNYKRDAAIVGGAGATGAAGYGAYQATQPQTTVPRGTTTTTGTSSSHAHDPTKPHPHHDPYSTEHHADRDAEYRKQTKGGLLGFLHKDQHGRYDDKDEPNTSAREKYYGTGNDHATHPLDSSRQDNDRSYAAPVAAGVVGAGATGAAGYGAYEAAHDDPRATQEHYGDRGTSGHGGQSMGGGAGHRAHEADTTRSTTGHPSTTTAAATGAGAVGAGGASSLSSRFDHHDPTGPSLTHGTTTGDYTSGYRPNALKESSLKAFYDDPTGVHQSHGLPEGGLPSGYAHEAARQEGGEEPHKRGLLDRVLHRDHPNKLHKEPPS